MAGSDSAGPGRCDRVGDDKSHEAADLIELLEFEITQIRSDQSRPGWTTWALMGSLATIVWLLTLEVEARAITVLNVLLLLLAFNLVSDCLCFLLPALLQPKGSGRNSRLDFSHTLFSWSRASLLAQAARSCAMIFVAMGIAPLVPTAVGAVACLFYGAWAFLMLFGLALSYLRWPVPRRGSASRLAHAVLGGLLALGIFALLGILRVIWQQGISPTWAEYRVGGLLLGIMILVQMLARERPRTPLLDSLVDLRRTLGLGKMDVESARRQTEIALAGMTVSDAFQADIEELLSHLTRARVELRAAANELAAGSSVVEERDSAITESQEALLDAVMSSTDKHVDEALAAHEEFLRRYKKIERRVLVLYRVLPGSGEEIGSLVEKLVEAQADLNAEAHRVKQEVSAFCEGSESLEQGRERAPASQAQVASESSSEETADM